MSSLLNIIFITILALAFVTSARIQKRDICAGCAIEVDINDPDLKELLTAVLADQNDDSELVRITKAMKQVVAGIKYMVEFETRDAGQSKICNTTFVHQPWLEQTLNVIDFDCQE